jgi:hypothetical protein
MTERPSIGQELYEDPDAAVERFRQEQRQERAQERAVEKFYDDFFRANPDLGTTTAKRMVVGSVLQENLSRWGNLSQAEGVEKLAEAVRRELKEVAAPYTEEAEPSTPSPRRSPAPEESAFVGGSLNHGTVWKEGPAPKEGSLGSAIRARRELRRQNSPGVRLPRGK